LFVALANHLRCKLWTGDKRLIAGLRKKSFPRIITTDELLELFIQKELNKLNK